MPVATDPAPPSTCAVIPVYDHPHAIVTVVDNLRHYNLPVVLVDDGSDAACATVLTDIATRHASVSLVRLPGNKGKGTAVVAGAREAQSRGFSHMLQIDADGQQDTSGIPTALTQARHYPDAMIIGVPVFDDSIPRSRLYGRQISNVLVWVQTWSLAIRDAMCGFRIYPLAPFVALADKHRIGARMDFDIDVAVRLVWDNTPVRCVPIAVHYPDDGISHFRMWRDNLRITQLHLRLLGGMLARTPHLARHRLRAAWHRQRTSD